MKNEYVHNYELYLRLPRDQLRWANRSSSRISSSRTSLQGSVCQYTEPLTLVWPANEAIILTTNGHHYIRTGYVVVWYEMKKLIKPLQNTFNSDAPEAPEY